MAESRTDLLSVTRTLVRAARVLCLFLVALLTIIFVALLAQLLRFIDSARQGNPFVPENGVRLRRMGWLLLAVNVVTNVAISVALTKGVKLPPVSFTAVMTVLMIFVIARIFDTGSAMREELRETV